MHASTAPAGHEPAGVMSQTCPSCHAGDIVTDYSAGDVICRGCGLVLGDHVIDDQIEWRTFADGNPKCVCAHRWQPAVIATLLAAAAASTCRVPAPRVLPPMPACGSRVVPRVSPCAAVATPTGLAASTTPLSERLASRPRFRGCAAALHACVCPSLPSACLRLTLDADRWCLRAGWRLGVG